MAKRYMTLTIFKQKAAEATDLRVLRGDVARLRPSVRDTDEVNQILFDATERIVHGRIG